VTCPDCRAEHDPRPCARDGATCSCCASLFGSAEERADACTALDATD